MGCLLFYSEYVQLILDSKEKCLEYTVILNKLYSTVLASEF